MKVGDKVRVFKGDNPHDWAEEMDQYIGREAVINGIGEDEKGMLIFIDIDPHGYTWTNCLIKMNDANGEVPKVKPKDQPHREAVVQNHYISCTTKDGKDVGDLLFKLSQSFELKPCPFCGGEAHFSNTWTDFYHVRCNECDAAVNDPQGGEYPNDPFAHVLSMQRAASVWNQRV